jgi:Fic family protein
MELGLALLEHRPPGLVLINALHERLMTGVRGGDKQPGQLRDQQVWIGSAGTPIEEARYVPPPPDLLLDLLTDWEAFVNADLDMPPLIQCALMHYQFEAINPYTDGNGRVGRLLITLFLCFKGILPTPLLYLSAFFDRHRDSYYEGLYRISATGEWEGWLRFFLTGVEEQAVDALLRLRRVRALQEEYRQLLLDRHESSNAFRLLDLLFANPFVTTPAAAEALSMTPAGTGRLIDRLVGAGILEYVGGNWPRVFLARRLLEAIDSPMERT